MGRVIIIGGGAIGLSLAYHLAKRGVDDVVLLERNQLTSGTSWHAAGIVGPLRSTPNMTRLAMYAGELFPRLEEETGQSTGYRVTGGYWLARVPERMDELQRIAALGRYFGLHAEVIAPETLPELLPDVNTNGIVGALTVREDAHVNPVDLCMAYAKAARGLGVDIREGIDVASLRTSGSRITGVRLADGEIMQADQVALCAGAWSKRLADSVGVALPLQAVEHMYVVSEPMPQLAQPFPVLRDLETGIYVKGDAGKLVIGGFEPDAKCWDAFGPEGDRPFLELAEDWEQFAPFMEAALNLIPDLEKTGIQHFMNGPESFTNDTRPLIGETPEVDGLFVAAGLNSVGIMSSAGVGWVLADWMVDGVPPMDPWEVDIARVDPKTAQNGHIRARMKQAVSDQFSMHWPYKQPIAGRGLRKSALHDCWASVGAHFGLTAGWERGLWYAQSETENDLPYSVATQPWQAIAEREAAVLTNGVALLDLSPFGKFDVVGTDALTFLNHICAAQINVAEGGAVYTPLMNRIGGIEADVTVSRYGAQHFRITSGAATWHKELAYLRRHSQGFDLRVTDRTEEEVVVGVMGAQTRELLQGLSSDDWVNFGVSTSRMVEVAGMSCRATRLSFVGELGWELSITAVDGPTVFEALSDAGARPMGHFALDGCRVEKGFKHWGHDLGPEITPLEAGLGFVVDWGKEFLGKDRLLKQRNSRLTRRLVLLEIGGDALMLHDEPIWENGRVVGLTTSGARGPRTGLNLAFGIVETGPGETIGKTVERQFSVEVAGTHYPATALRRPPFDPGGERMRA
ncbi:MAG: FAD-dependent oxidoreductase [Rhodobacteraceae bacterium]|nr:FAD-dependent oxidoreductase [Paracoccaceae bacterium]